MPVVPALVLADTVAVFGVESPAYSVIRFVQFSAVTILIGSLALVQVVLPRFTRTAADHDSLLEAIVARVLRWTRIALITLAFATLARLAAQHVVYFEDARWSMETMRPLLLLSGWGHAWLLAGAAILLGLFAHRLASQRRRGSWPLLTFTTFALAWSLAMSGHAAAASDPLVAMTLDAMHVVAAGGWMGSLAMLMVIAVPTALETSDEDGHRLVARLIAAFSPTALVFASLLVVTGLIAAWRNLGSLHALLTSAYGQLLILKLLLVFTAAATGAINWRRVLPRLGLPSATRTLRRSATFEIAIAIAILAVTAVLVAAPTPDLSSVAVGP